MLYLQGCQLAIASNIQRQVRTLASSVHSIIERDASLCAVTAVAVAAARQQTAKGQRQPGAGQGLRRQQTQHDATAQRRGGLAAAIGAADPTPPQEFSPPEAVDAQATAAAVRDSRLQLRHVAEQVQEATGYSLAVHSSAAWQAGRGLWLQGSAQVPLNI